MHDASEAIALVFFETREALEELENVALPWFADNLRSHLSGPVPRSTGEVVVR